MNWVDILFFLIIIRTAYIGYARGLGYELFKTLGVVSAFFIIINTHQAIGEFITDHSVISEPFSELLSFVILVGSILFLFRIIGQAINNIMKIEFVSILDRTGGILLGAGRGIVCIFLMIIAFNITTVEYINESIYKRSLSGPYIIGVMEKATSLAERLWDSFQRQS